MQTDFNKFVYYDPTSFSGLRWAATFGPKAKINNPIGCYSYLKNKTPNHIKGSINKVQYPLHRIVWELHHGLIPAGMVIDHLGGNPFNNKIENLRACTQATNSRNSKKKTNNASGVTGVYWTIKPPGVEYAVSKIHHPEKGSISKSFSAKKYGKEKAFELACEHRQILISLLESEGYKMTERNGI